VIVIEVACDDEIVRAVVADLLARQRDMLVLSNEHERSARAADLPDVVVFGVSPHGDIESSAEEYLEMAARGAAVVVFCTTSSQADDFAELGVEHVLDADEPARELAATVRAAYRRRGRVLH
jgi:DNA-binding NarL/FixJ family response regulator